MAELHNNLASKPSSSADFKDSAKYMSNETTDETAGEPTTTEPEALTASTSNSGEQDTHAISDESTPPDENEDDTISENIYDATSSRSSVQQHDTLPPASKTADETPLDPQSASASPCSSSYSAFRRSRSVTSEAQYDSNAEPHPTPLGFRHTSPLPPPFHPPTSPPSPQATTTVLQVTYKCPPIATIISYELKASLSAQTVFIVDLMRVVYYLARYTVFGCSSLALKCATTVLRHLGNGFGAVRDTAYHISFLRSRNLNPFPEILDTRFCNRPDVLRYTHCKSVARHLGKVIPTAAAGKELLILTPLLILSTPFWTKLGYHAPHHEILRLRRCFLRAFSVAFPSTFLSHDEIKKSDIGVFLSTANTSEPGSLHREWETIVSIAKHSPKKIVLLTKPENVGEMETLVNSTMEFYKTTILQSEHAKAVGGSTMHPPPCPSSLRPSEAAGGSSMPPPPRPSSYRPGPSFSHSPSNIRDLSPSGHHSAIMHLPGRAPITPRNPVFADCPPRPYGGPGPAPSANRRGDAPFVQPPVHPSWQNPFAGPALIPVPNPSASAAAPSAPAPASGVGVWLEAQNGDGVYVGKTLQQEPREQRKKGDAVEAEAGVYARGAQRLKVEAARAANPRIFRRIANFYFRIFGFIGRSLLWILRAMFTAFAPALAAAAAAAAPPQPLAGPTATKGPAATEAAPAPWETAEQRRKREADEAEAGVYARAAERRRREAARARDPSIFRRIGNIFGRIFGFVGNTLLWILRAVITALMIIPWAIGAVLSWCREFRPDGSRGGPRIGQLLNGSPSSPLDRVVEQSPVEDPFGADTASNASMEETRQPQRLSGYRPSGRPRIGNVLYGGLPPRMRNLAQPPRPPPPSGPAPPPPPRGGLSFSGQPGGVPNPTTEPPPPPVSGEIPLCRMSRPPAVRRSGPAGDALRVSQSATLGLNQPQQQQMRPAWIDPTPASEAAPAAERETQRLAAREAERLCVIAEREEKERKARHAARTEIIERWQGTPIATQITMLPDGVASGIFAGIEWMMRLPRRLFQFAAAMPSYTYTFIVNLPSNIVHGVRSIPQLPRLIYFHVNDLPHRIQTYIITFPRRIRISIRSATRNTRRAVNNIVLFLTRSFIRTCPWLVIIWLTMTCAHNVIAKTLLGLFLSWLYAESGLFVATRRGPRREGWANRMNVWGNRANVVTPPMQVGRLQYGSGTMQAGI